MINHDGVDLDMCRDVTISDCIIRTGDDCLFLRAIQQVSDQEEPCERIVVSNCILESSCQGIRIGCPSDGVIRHAVFSNLVIARSHNGVLMEFPHRYLAKGDTGSASILDLNFSTISIECRQHPIRLPVEPGIFLGRIEQIAFSSFTAKGGSPCVIHGSPETIIPHFRFAGVSIECGSPEPIILRNCDNFTLNDVRMSRTLIGLPETERE